MRIDVRDDFFVDFLVEIDAHDQRKDFRNRKCPPDKRNVPHQGKQVGCRQQHHDLTDHGNPQTQAASSEGLEHGTGNDVVACSNIAETDDPQSRDTDFQHFIGCIEQLQKCSGNQQENGSADEHDRHRIFFRQADGLLDPFFLVGTVVIGDDRNHSVVQAENRHEDETLELEVDTENSGRSRCETDQDIVQAQVQEGSDSLHQNRWAADRIDFFDRMHIRAEPFKR